MANKIGQRKIDATAKLYAENAAKIKELQDANKALATQLKSHFSTYGSQPVGLTVYEAKGSLKTDKKALEVALAQIGYKMSDFQKRGEAFLKIRVK